MFLFLLFLGSSKIFVEEREEKAFLLWMRDSQNSFVGEEYFFRFGIWLQNKRKVAEHNANADIFGYTLSLNHLSHLTENEYKNLLGTKISDFKLFDDNIVTKVEKQQNNYKYKNIGLKDDYPPIDYRDFGVLNEVKDQGQCGSCWAFSITSAAESNYALRFSTLYSYSEQNLVDCVTSSFGCNGGLLTSSMYYIMQKQNGKFMQEGDYPYTAATGTCRYDASKAVGSLTNVISTPQGSEPILARCVAEYGVACAIIDASHFSFQLYSSGVYYDPSCSSQNLDHGVSVIGYGDDYWIIRNSYGKDWGEDGYMRLAKDRNNHCGIATMACFPIP